MRKLVPKTLKIAYEDIEVELMGPESRDFKTLNSFRDAAAMGVHQQVRF